MTLADYALYTYHVVKFYDERKVKFITNRIAVYTYSSIGNDKHIAEALNKIEVFVARIFGNVKCEIYADSNSNERENFEKLMDNVRANKYDVLIVPTLNRLYRVYPENPESEKRFMEIWDELKRHGVKVIDYSKQK